MKLPLKDGFKERHLSGLLKEMILAAELCATTEGRSSQFGSHCITAFENFKQASPRSKLSNASELGSGTS